MHSILWAAGVVSRTDAVHPFVMTGTGQPAPAGRSEVPATIRMTTEGVSFDFEKIKQCFWQALRTVFPARVSSYREYTPVNQKDEVAL